MLGAAQVGEDGEYAPVVALGGGQVEFEEDVVDVRVDGFRGEH